MKIHTPEMTDEIYEGLNIFRYNGQNIFTKEYKSSLLDMNILTQATQNGHIATDVTIDLREDLKQYISYDYIKLGFTYANRGPFEFHLGDGKNKKVFKVPQGWYISLSVKSLQRGIDSFNSSKNSDINSIHFVLPAHTVKKFAQSDSEISQICHEQLNGGSKEMIVAYGPADSYMKDKIKTIIDSKEFGKVGEMIAEREMELLFLYILMDSIRKKEGSFEKIKSIIKENIKSAPTVEQIAKLAGVSPRTLHNIFKQKAGVSPKNFIQIQRLEKAQIMLSKKEGSVNEIAKSLGFSNAHHFSLQFKKRFGVTPFEMLNGVC